MFLVLTTLILALNLFAQPIAAQETERPFEVVAELPEGPGNIAVTPQGRIIISMHQFFSPEHRVMEVLPSGELRPFPNEEWSSAPDKRGVGFNAVLGIRSDARGVVWMLDNGTAGGATPKIVGWDTVRNALKTVIHLPHPVTRAGSFHNDLAVDLLHEAVYISDLGGEGGPAIVVVDLKTGFSRRVLAGHQSVVAEDVPMVVEDRLVTILEGGGESSEARIGINPITIDPANKWVYYGAMHGTSVYRVRTTDLLNTELDDDQLGERVERYGTKPVSDGISVDSTGNVYITDVTGNAIGVTSPDGQYRRLISDGLILWPDGMSYGPDGYFYVTVNQLHRSAILNEGQDITMPPFLIIRFKPLTPSAIGR